VGYTSATVEWEMEREELDRIDAQERYLDLKRQLDELDHGEDSDGDYSGEFDSFLILNFDICVFLRLWPLFRYKSLL
jgi:hypothetical protein